MDVRLYQNQERYDAEYQRIRVVMVERGSSLSAWLNEEGINRQLAYKALKGRSFGRKSRELRTRILVALLSDAA